MQDSDEQIFEFCPEHGEIPIIDDHGIYKCSICERATSTTPEGAQRYKQQP